MMKVNICIFNISKTILLILIDIKLYNNNAYIRNTNKYIYQI